MGAIKVAPSACIHQVCFICTTALYSCDRFSHRKHEVEGKNSSHLLQMSQKSFSSLTCRKSARDKDQFISCLDLGLDSSEKQMLPRFFSCCIRMSNVYCSPCPIADQQIV